MNLPISLFSTPWLDEATFINLGTIAFCLMIVFAIVGIVSLLVGKSPSTEAKPAANPAPSPAQPAADPTPAQVDDGALIAVLTAAVAATLEAEAAATGTPAPAFRVVSFQRSSRGRSWNA